MTGVQTCALPILLHRPGAELSRLTEANRDQLLFDVVPSLGQMRAEHDAFARVLSEHGAEVLLLGDLLPQTIEHSGAARIQGISAAVSERRLGPQLAAEVSGYLRALPPAELARVLIAGLSFDELPAALKYSVLSATGVSTATSAHAPEQASRDNATNRRGLDIRLPR